MKRRKLLTTIVLCLLVLQACTKPIPVPEEPDWRDRYGMSANETVTPEPTTPEPTPTKNPVESPFSTIELPYPTPLPMREFVPEERQVELVLWMFGSHEDYWIIICWRN